MMSFESLISYLFFILIALSISAHSALPEKNTSLQAYSLLLDTITVLEKSHLPWDFENGGSRALVLSKFSQITGQTGFCITAEPPRPLQPVSNCASPGRERFTQEAILPSPSGIPQKIFFSMQKEGF